MWPLRTAMAPFFNHAHALIAGGYARVVPEAYGVGIRRFRRFRHDPPMLAVPWRFIASVAYSCRRNAPRRSIRRHPMIYDNILGTIGRTQSCACNDSRRRTRRCTSSASFSIRQVRSRIVWQSPIIEDAEKNREAQARSDGGRGHLRKHRYCSWHGVRGQGLSLRRRHG